MDVLDASTLLAMTLQEYCSHSSSLLSWAFYQLNLETLQPHTIKELQIFNMGTHTWREYNNATRTLHQQIIVTFEEIYLSPLHDKHMQQCALRHVSVLIHCISCNPRAPPSLQQNKTDGGMGQSLPV
jgi:hypothetical protein